ncbi:MAG: 5'-3' exonuclease [Acetatifactor sp.]|nr:5'-3' exonuclease [Acetatifactor sp.]
MEITEEKLLLVDGHNLLFQMFYGMPARIINQDGRAIQGTLGFVGALLKIIRRIQPSHVAVIFDGEHENQRKDLSEDYKANRPDYSKVPEEENPFSQLPDVYRALQYLGIPYWETQEYEADDEIAAYVYAYAMPKDGRQIVISSFDSDFFQLIAENVSVLRYRGEKTVLCDVAYIREKLGIEPFQYAEYKALTGDKADNIVGIRGVGAKTAAELMRQFGSLEELLAHRAEIRKPSLQKVFLEEEERLRRNYQLIRLDGGAPIPRQLEELVWQDCGLTTTEVLRGIGLK